MKNNKEVASPHWTGFFLLVEILFLVIFVGLMVVSPCASRLRPQRTLKVFFPCGTVGPVSQALEAFKKKKPEIQIQPVVDKGKPLAQRLKKGETCDLFIGRPEEMQPLLKEKLVDPTHQVPIAAQILSLVVPADNPANLRSLKDLTSPRLQTLAIAPAKSHPGKYTRQALQRLGLTGKIKARQVIPEDADSLPALVGKGEVQAAILFRSCVQLGVDAQGKPISPKRIRIIADLPASSHDPITLSAAAAANSAHPEEARRLVAFLSTPQARGFFLQSGFRKPAGDKTTSPRSAAKR